MFVYEKKLQYPIRIKNTNPQLASFIISQYGGPDGELGASLRYLSQRYAMPYPELKAVLTDIGVEELGHLDHPVALGRFGGGNDILLVDPLVRLVDGKSAFLKVEVRRGQSQ